MARPASTLSTPAQRPGAHRRDAGGAAVFERVNSSLLDGAGFRASDSIGLDGAPSMVFQGAMPPYSREIDRPSTSLDEAQGFAAPTS